MINAIIFDMDGVLIDAKEWHYEALNKALRLFGFEISRYEHLTSYDGLPTKRKLEMLTVERGLPIELHEFINELKQDYTFDLIHTQCNPRFIHEYALARLQSEGYRVALASNSIRSSVDLMIKKARLDKYLEFSLSNQDVQKGKPDPEIYHKAIKKMGLRANECLIVEDNPNGVKAALASGAHLLKVDNVEEVTFDNIKRRIGEINLRGVGL
jgi:HAD superfamily hydrolase (TIGR01509 family)